MNHKILTRKGYILNKKKITASKKKKIEKDLIVEPISHPDFASDNQKFKIYLENEDSYCVPRYYGIQNFGKPIKEIPMDLTKINVNFKGSLRPKQIPIIDECLKRITNDGGGIISLHCGAGKTVLAIYLATLLGLKTLVVVHKTFLQNQWYDRIKQFTDAKIGMIRQKKVDVKGKDIVIGMLQSISMIDYDPATFDDIGLVIIDECHHVSSRVFSKALLKIGAKYTIGLSATPKRADGLSKVFMWYLGDIIYRLERKGDNDVIIKMFNYQSNDKLFVEKKQWIKGNMKPSTPKMITNICKINSRNNFCIDIINTIRKQPERKILVLSGRLDHLNILKNGLDKIINNDIDNGDLEIDEVKTSFYVGGMKDYQLTDSALSDVIFATYDMAEEGLDIDSLNTLFFASPKRNIIQAIGRILRKQSKECLIKPLVIDINDSFSVFPNWTDSRKKYYNKEKYNIEHFQAYNNKCISVKDYLIINKYIDNNDNNNNFEYLREKYICGKYSPCQYEFEKEDDFENCDLNNYQADLDSILKLDN